MTKCCPERGEMVDAGAKRCTHCKYPFQGHPLTLLLLGFIALLVIAGLLAGCDNRPRQWDAFIYPNFEGSDEYETIRGFKTFELCQAAAINRIRQLPNPDEAQFECGYKCEDRPGMNSNICEETRD